jgi:endoglucanase
MVRVFAALALLLASLPSCAQFAHTKGEEVIGRDGQPLHIRGTNLGNWMVPEGYFWRFDGAVQSPQEIDHFFIKLLGPTQAAAFWQKWRDTWITQADLHFLHQAGFNTLRVPLNAGLFRSNDSDGFRLLDRLVTWARAEDLYLILDMHAAPGGGTGSNIDDSDGYPWVYEDSDSRTAYLDLWQRIAHRYRKEPTVLGYDLLNEPLPHYPVLAHLQPMLEPLYKQAAARIRQEDKNHILILEGSQWDTDYTVFGAPFDSNTVYEIHHYGSADTSFAAPYLAFRAKYHVPLYLGEAGENNDAWMATMRSFADEHNIGWTFWPYKKLHGSSALVTAQLPPEWNAIVAYSKVTPGVALHKENFPARPDQAIIDRTFTQVLAHVGFAESRVNSGYLKALLPDSPMLPAAQP